MLLLLLLAIINNVVSLSILNPNHHHNNNNDDTIGDVDEIITNDHHHPNTDNIQINNDIDKKLQEDIPIPQFPFHDIRISRTTGKYDQIRVTLITHSPPHFPSTNNNNNNKSTYYSQPFQHAWTNFHLTTKLVRVKPGTRLSNIPLPNNLSISVSLPGLGASVSGLILGDPCYSSKYKGCEFGIQYRVHRRLARALNLLSHEIDFYSLLGDNFYDLKGDLTAGFFSLLTKQTKSLFFSTVLGNHDLWAQGNPMLQVANDQRGWGFAQYYGQDVLSSTPTMPLNFTVDNEGYGPSSNYFSYHAIGGLGFILYSGAHELNPKQFELACEYFDSGEVAKHVSLIFLIGHWSIPLLDGCFPKMDVPSLFAWMKNEESPMPTCRRLLVDEQKMMFIMGHVHSNVITGKRGMMVGGAGMLGEGHFGLPLFELHNEENPPRLEVSYFPFAIKRHDPFVSLRFARFESCMLRTRTFKKCKYLSKNWFNVTLGGMSSSSSSSTELLLSKEKVLDDNNNNMNDVIMSKV
jgi:hypothetical protein